MTSTGGRFATRAVAAAQDDHAGASSIRVIRAKNRTSPGSGTPAWSSPLPIRALLESRRDVSYAPGGVPDLLDLPSGSRGRTASVHSPRGRPRPHALVEYVGAAPRRQARCLMRRLRSAWGVSGPKAFDVLARARALGEQGRHVVHPRSASPTSTPKASRRRRAATSGERLPSPDAGVPELREAISIYLNRARGLAIDTSM